MKKRWVLGLGLIALAVGVLTLYFIWPKISGPPDSTDVSPIDVLPTKGKIVFESGPLTGSIWYMNTDGTNQTLLLRSVDTTFWQPAISPDGKMIAFVSDSWYPKGGRGRNIYYVRADGKGLTKLTNEGDNENPSWSPDSQWIIFRSSKEINTTGFVDFVNYDIYKVSISNKTMVRLTDLLGNEEWPSYSPDGKNIAFSHGEHRWGEIYIVDADGNDLRKLTDFWWMTKFLYKGNITKARVSGASHLSWSQDSKKIVFEAGMMITVGTRHPFKRQIFVLDISNGNFTKLTGPIDGIYYDDKWPSWSLDGQKIAFSSDRYGNYDIFIMNTDGTGVTRLTDDPAREMHPTWSSP